MEIIWNHLTLWVSFKNGIRNGRNPRWNGGCIWNSCAPCHSMGKTITWTLSTDEKQQKSSSTHQTNLRLFQQIKHFETDSTVLQNMSTKKRMTLQRLWLLSLRSWLVGSVMTKKNTLWSSYNDDEEGGYGEHLSPVSWERGESPNIFLSKTIPNLMWGHQNLIFIGL